MGSHGQNLGAPPAQVNRRARPRRGRWLLVVRPTELRDEQR
ncbi:Hypothetical protein A7982_02128 [Minicystis rosea]|nr:Hypothetical protein A7982_02128 [Minicystis rosea]